MTPRIPGVTERRGTARFRVGLALVIAIALLAAFWMSGGPKPTSSGNPSGSSNPACKGTAHCFTGTVTYIVDGDTLDIGGTRIRLALVNTPEIGQPGYQEGKDFTANLCPVGSTALVDEDDRQTGGSYGRMIAVVYCGGTNLNAALLTAGLADVLTQYCSVSEFAADPWAAPYC
ncbi:MAG TPA: thermonuclease family protein [Thermoplasmata archaeon]|nr:thermonuclease family protein [Thermoplasmata archaeon]